MHRPNKLIWMLFILLSATVNCNKSVPVAVYTGTLISIGCSIGIDIDGPAGTASGSVWVAPGGVTHNNAAVIGNPCYVTAGQLAIGDRISFNVPATNASPGPACARPLCLLANMPGTIYIDNAVKVN